MSRVSIFGQPGSGKTTLAKAIAKKSGYKIIEASVSVVFPIASNFEKLPKEEYLLKNISKKKSKKISREKAMETFSKLKNTYSPDFIARALNKLYAEKPKPKNTIFSGLRGLDNAKYCRLHNDFVIYLKSNKKDLIKRLRKDRGYTKQQAEDELKKEKKLYKTEEIEKVADLVINTSTKNLSQTLKQALIKIENQDRMCKRCVNTGKNPAIKFDKDGYCNICSSYVKNFDPKHLKKELEVLKSFKGAGKKYDVIVGISGGKDSTATLYTIKQMGFTPLAVTFDLGYLPKTTIPRARETAKSLGVDYEVVDIRKYIRKIDLASYKKTIKLYELPFTLETKNKFKKAYDLGRKHYSVKCKHSPIFVRTCQLCRRTVIRSYYDESLKRGVGAFVLGINEWTNLSAAQNSKRYKGTSEKHITYCNSQISAIILENFFSITYGYSSKIFKNSASKSENFATAQCLSEVPKISGIRKLQPEKNKPAVYIFHLPFLLQRTSKKTKKILDRLGWKAPKGEDFIESNSNSCLYARSTERMAKRLLEFHPDSTRLAREVTVGFITKKQAIKALGKIHKYKYTPRQVLQMAKILKK